MKQVLLTAFTLAFLTAGLQSIAQETKTKSKSDADKTKVKTETPTGESKVVMKGEGMGMNLDAVRQEINMANQLWGQSFVKGDSAALVGLYHSEARIYPPNMAMMNNRTEWGRMLAGVPASGIQRMELNTTDVIGGPEVVVETGTYQMHDASKMVDRGKYMVVWKQENGRWRIYRDIWNSDMPPTMR